MTYIEKKKKIISTLQELESSLVSYLVTHPEEIIKTGFTADDITTPKLRTAFSAILESVTNNRDLVACLMDKDISLRSIIDLYDYRPINTLCAEIKKYSKLNNVLDTFYTHAETLDIFGDIDAQISEIQNQLVKINRLHIRKSNDIESLMQDFDNQVTENKNKKGMLGLDTGFPKLNSRIDGIRPGHLWIVGAYTSGGKTFFALNLMKSIIKQGKRAVFYSLEMSESDIIARTLGIMSKQNSMEILKGWIDTPEEKQELKKSNLSIITDINEISKIKMSMIEQNMKSPVDVFFIDYLQLVQSKKHDNEYDVMRLASHELQEIGKHLNIPIIVLSQISNESAKNPDGRVMGYKGAGNIAAAADLAIELNPGEEDYETFRQKMNDGREVVIKCVVKKNRHGKVGAFETTFHSQTGIFKEAGEDISEIFKQF